MATRRPLLKSAARAATARRAGSRPRRLLAEVLRRGAPFASLGVVEPLDRIALVKEGVPARALVVIAAAMGISQDKLYAMIGLPRATAARKIRKAQPLSVDESERVLGVARLVGEVERIVRESGSAKGFDAARWLAAWLDRPNAALGGRRPGGLMDTADGRGMVSDLVLRMQTGAYA